MHAEMLAIMLGEAKAGLLFTGGTGRATVRIVFDVRTLHDVHGRNLLERSYQNRFRGDA